MNRDFTATWRRGYGYGDEFDDLGHFEELRAGEDPARSAREASAAYDAKVASELARIRAINAGRAGGGAWDPTGLLVPSLAAKSLSASAPATAQGPDAAPLTTTIGIEDDAALLADVMKVSPHVDTAPKISTTGEPSINLFEEATKEFTDRLETTTAPETTTRPAPLDEVAAPGAEPALQPLVFFSPAPSTVKAPKRTAAAAEAQPVVFISSDPTPKTPTTAAAPKVSTTGEPSVDLFEVAAQEFVEALTPEARPATPRVFMEDLSKIGSPFTVAAPAAAPHAVTKIAPSWEPVIVPSAAAVETVTKVEPELDVVVKEKPFTPMPEEDGPTTPGGKNRRRPRGSDDDQDEDAAKRRDRRAAFRQPGDRRGGDRGPGRRRAGGRALFAGSRPQPQLSVGEQDDHDGRTGPRFDATAEAPQETSPVLA